MAKRQSPPLEHNSRRGTNGHSPGKDTPAVGSLSRNLPDYVKRPPVEAVVFGWGVAEDGQLGVDTAENVMMPKVVEALLGTRFCGRSFSSAPLIGGSRNSLALDVDGQILAWGWNARATLGLGHGQEFIRKPRRVSALSNIRITQVTIGGWHCLALGERGDVYAWGGNEYGQCALPPEQKDIKVPTACVPHLHVTQVAAGGMHSCVLTSEGEIWTWGEPWGDFSMEVDRKPRKVACPEKIAKIACGAFHNLFLTRSGLLYSMGINDFGQLGNGSTDYQVRPGRVLGLEDVEVADIAAGGWHSLAITAAGEVYIFGRGEYGRLGLGEGSGSSKLRATHVRGLEGHRVVQASCGGTHTMVLTDAGRIFAWGRCSYGRLGGPMERDCYSPVEIYLPGGPERWRVISICCGGRHSLALALPDNEASSLASTRASRKTSAELYQLPPGEPLTSCTEADEADVRPAEPHTPTKDFDEDGDDEDEGSNSLEAAGGRSPQDLVEELIRQEAQEDAEEADLNGGALSGTSEDLDENGAYKESPGGESPGLPSDSTHVNQQQLNFHLSVHGLRDVESDD